MNARSKWLEYPKFSLRERRYSCRQARCYEQEMSLFSLYQYERYYIIICTESLKML